MQKICGLKHTPMFNPIIDDYYSGMLVCVPLMGFDTAQIKDVYKKHYQTNQIQLKDAVDTAFLAANTMSGSDDMELYVFGCEEHDEYGRNKRTLLVARFDNLGKGASGAAVQCFNLMLSGGST
jgi:N-acetyl-gamma-glutamyl-phosphate reductase